MLSLNILPKPVDQTWSIKRIATEAPPRTWETLFANARNELDFISDRLDEQERDFGMYYPLKSDIFAAFNYTTLPNVKVVILGQDPYHQTIVVNGVSLPRAVGLSFSVRQEDSIPSSLQNIYTELANTVRGFTKPDHGDLRDWARQGVLLLNTCLTVRPGVAGSHGDLWLDFIVRVFKAIAAVNPYCVYMLWGREAQKLRSMLGERSIVLEAAHPSGLSARRGFFGSNHFNLANEALIKHGKVGINWRIRTLAELRRESSGAPLVASDSSKSHFAPVRVDLLPFTTKPDVVQASQVKVAPPIQAMLPTIPNTKPMELPNIRLPYAHHSQGQPHHVQSTNIHSPQLLLHEEEHSAESETEVSSTTVPDPGNVRPIIPVIRFGGGDTNKTQSGAVKRSLPTLIGHNTAGQNIPLQNQMVLPVISPLMLS